MNKYGVFVSISPDNRLARIPVSANRCEVNEQHILAFYGEADAKVAEFHQWHYWQLVDKIIAPAASAAA
jgi:hypothetical protein